MICSLKVGGLLPHPTSSLSLSSASTGPLVYCPYKVIGQEKSLLGISYILSLSSWLPLAAHQLYEATDQARQQSAKQ